MPRSSESVAALASALAKAQAELVNPEKSLTATIRTGRAGRGRAQLPLCAALERPRHRAQDARPARDRHRADHRHRPGRRHGQSDHHAGACLRRMDRLGLAGLSRSPRLPIPQRMGAALTYARRYALFTLVGIAGEDDLDAPDLCDGPRSPAPSADERSLKPGHGQPPVQPRKPGNGQRRHGMHGERPSTLEPEQSAALREKLLTAVGNITSADSAAIWAQEALAAKNSLAAADAKLVEDAFEHRLSELAPSATAEAADDAAPTTRVERVGAHETRRERKRRPRSARRHRQERARDCRHRGAIATGSTFALSPNKRASSAAANHPIRIIFASCSRGRSAAKSAMNSPSRSAARITARSIAPATSRPGGRRPASTPSRSPVSSGDKPGSMIRKIVTRRVSRRARRLDRLPRHLTVRGNRGPIRLS